MNPSNELPRKVVIGTCIYAMYGGRNPYPGLESRLKELADLIDRMAVQADTTYGCGLDLAVLPEVAVNGGLEGTAAQVSFPLQGMVAEHMGAVARQHGTYVIVPMFLEEEDGASWSNACILINREG